MALDTRSRSTWRRETSIRSWQTAGRDIAVLRDLGAANVPDLDLNIAGSRFHTRREPGLSSCGPRQRQCSGGRQAGEVRVKKGRVVLRPRRRNLSRLSAARRGRSVRGELGRDSDRG